MARGNSVAMSNRDVAALLESWGFEEAGYKGGHMIMKKNDRQVQISAPARHTPTPFKALRKAARIVGVPLKDLLAGPPQAQRTEPMKRIDLDVVEVQNQEEQVAVVIPEPVVAELSCEICGKTGFKNTRGLGGHRNSHKMVRCNGCGHNFSAQGIGSHRAHCGPKKRGPGRPRKPIAEVPSSKRRGNVKTDVEVPEALVLDDLEESFPDAEAFSFKDETVEEPVVSPWMSLVEEAVTEAEIALGELKSEQVRVLLDVFLPERDLSNGQIEDFLNWVEASRVAFEAMFEIGYDF